MQSRSPEEVKLWERASLAQLLPHLSRLDLLHLRIFVLTRLGVRSAATTAAFRQRWETHQKVSKVDLWSVEVVEVQPQDGG